MNNDLNILLEHEQTARRQADRLLKQKSLQLSELNHMLQLSLDEKSKEIHALNTQLSIALEDTSNELVDNLSLLREYKKAIDHSTIVSMANKDGTIIYANDAFCKTSGYTRKELIGQNHNIIRHPDTPNNTFKEMWRKLNKKESWNGTLKNLSKEGETYYVDTTISPILHKNGEVKKFLALRYNITNAIKQEQRINRHITDRLTGFPNRTQLIEDLENGEYKYITILNIDSFQEINNLYGQTIGDDLLKNFTHYLANNLNEKVYTLYKLPADEFAIAAQDTFDKRVYTKVINDLIKQFDNNLFTINDNEIHINLTGGMCIRDGNENMLDNADIALKKAKSEKIPFILFNKDMQEKERYAKNQIMLKTLKDAIENNRMIPYFQPIFSSKTMKIEKYETLMRLEDEKGEIILPSFFLEVAKKSRIYCQLTKIMIEKSFEIFRNKNIKFSINLSVEDITDLDTCRFIFNKLERLNWPQNVIFEITESEEINNYNIIKSFIEEVKRYGAQIAIDDFGSGYSNFMNLLELKVDYIKIDGSIIKNIVEDKNSQVLTKAILTVAKELNIKVIAEYVYTEAILNTIKVIGVDYFQGYYLGEPLPDIIE